MRQRDWRRDGNQDDLSDNTEIGEGTLDLRKDAPLYPDEMTQLLLQETITRAKAAELSAFRRFEEDGASDAEWHLLLMETSPTIH